MLKLNAVFWLLIVCCMPAYSINSYSKEKKFWVAWQVSDGIVRGVVTDDQGGPVPAVTITVKNKSAKTATDANGKYAIQLCRISSKGSFR